MLFQRSIGGGGGGGGGSGIKFYLLFNTDIGNFVWKINEGVAGNVFLLIFLFGGA